MNSAAPVARRAHVIGRRLFDLQITTIPARRARTPYTNALELCGVPAPGVPVGRKQASVRDIIVLIAVAPPLAVLRHRSGGG